MLFIKIKSSNALFQSEERLVNLRALHPSLPVSGVGVGSPLVARQVDEGELSMQRLPSRVLPQYDLENRVTSGRVGVGASLARGSQVVAVGD